MDLVISQKGFLHESQALSPLPNSPSTSLVGSALHSSHSNFPVIAVALIGILATGFLLVSYYIFVIKCCLDWHRIDPFRRFSFSYRQHNESQLMVHPPGAKNRGLDEAIIRSIPIFQYKKGERKTGLRRERSFCECAVCLNEFQEEEKLRVIPSCAHVFHIDCIDIWLQNSANCPLCRTSISAQSQIMVPIFSPRDRHNHSESFTGRDEDCVVEITEQNNPNHPLLRAQERLNSRELSQSSHSKASQKEKKSLTKASSLGDEWIDIRQKDEQFAIQPIRRSFSMDSAVHPILHLAVQEIMQQQKVTDASPSEDFSSRMRRSFFNFGHGRVSRSTVLPVHLEP